MKAVGRSNQRHKTVWGREDSVATCWKCSELHLADRVKTRNLVHKWYQDVKTEGGERAGSKVSAPNRVD